MFVDAIIFMPNSSIISQKQSKNTRRFHYDKPFYPETTESRKKSLHKKHPTEIVLRKTFSAHKHRQKTIFFSFSVHCCGQMKIKSKARSLWSQRLSIKLEEMLVVPFKIAFSSFFFSFFLSIKMIKLLQFSVFCVLRHQCIETFCWLKIKKKKAKAFEPNERIKLCVLSACFKSIIPATRRNFVLDLCSLVTEKRNLYANFPAQENGDFLCCFSSVLSSLDLHKYYNKRKVQFKKDIEHKGRLRRFLLSLFMIDIELLCSSQMTLYFFIEACENF